MWTTFITTVAPAFELFFNGLEADPIGTFVAIVSFLGGFVTLAIWIENNL
jgi:hypothetical protein